MRAPAGRSLRARVRTTVLATVTGALLLFGLPLALVLGRLIESQALAALQRDATRTLAAVPDDAVSSGSLGALAGQGRRAVGLGVYGPGGVRVAGQGPRRSGLAARTRDGREHDGDDRGDLAVAAPVVSDGVVVGSVRAGEARSSLGRRVHRAWALLALLALLVSGVAALLAERAVRRIAGPFEHLTSAAQLLGSGRYDLELPRWGIAEADAAADALSESARAVDALVRHERDFVRHASHQLRTPLSGVLLRLEQEPPDVPGALQRAHDLETTIADLLVLRAPGGSASCWPTEVAQQAVDRWSTPSRPVTLRADGSPGAALPAAALRQALDVLVDNALRHGAAPVSVTVEPYGDSVVVEVADAGPGLREGWRPGTGLQLATGIVERAGGSLWVRSDGPRPRIAMLLPAQAAPEPEVR